MNWRIYVFLLAAWPLHASAETHYLLVDPGKSPSHNYFRYYNDVRRAYESLRSLGKTPTVIAKDGKWKLEQAYDESLSSFSLTPEGQRQPATTNSKLSYPPIQGPARDLGDITKAIREMKLQPGDSLVLYFTAHGGPPKHANDPSSATIQAWKSEFEFNQLTDALKKVPKDIPIKLITTTCFGGGIHSVARSLPNVCSAATTNHFQPSSSGSLDEFQFNRGLWNNFVRTGGHTTFAAANLEGFQGDYANLNVGRLSSFDYVDFVLKRGPYQKTWSSVPTRWMEVDSKKFEQVRPPDDYSPALPADSLVFSPYSSLWEDLGRSEPADKTCYVNPVQADLDRIERFSAILRAVTENALSSAANQQPGPLRTVFHDVIDDLKKNGPRYMEVAQAYDAKYRDLVARWNAYEAQSRAAQAGADGWRNEGDARAKMQKEFDELKRSAERDLQAFSFDHQMLDRLAGLDEFAKVATPEQKSKLVQLLQCEWAPL